MFRNITFYSLCYFFNSIHLSSAPRAVNPLSSSFSNTCTVYRTFFSGNDETVSEKSHIIYDF